MKVMPRLLGAAIGLAALHSAIDREDGGGSVTTRDDVLFVLDGHIADWSGWTSLAEEDARRFMRLLRRRPNSLANVRAAGPLLDRCLIQGEIAGCVADEFYKEDGRILVDPGMALRDFVDGLLKELDDLHVERRRDLRPAGPGPHTAVARSRSSGGAEPGFTELRFEIRGHHAEPARTLPRIEDAPPERDRWVAFAELEEIAGLLDKGLGGTHRVGCVQRFSEEIRTASGEVADGLLLTAGSLRELLAYTGFGKSVVLVESFACWAARHGVSVAFALPTNADVVRTAHQIERALEVVLPDGGPGVVPLVSPRAMFEVAETAAANAASSEKEGPGPDADWIWRRFGYGCALAAAATSENGAETWLPGREPCAGLLRPRKRRRRDERVACPWRTTCGRFRAVRDACSAGIIVTSHKNLMAGVLQAPVDDGSGADDRIAVEELILRRCQVVVIDEVDLFQRSAIEEAGRGLVLDHARRTNTPLRRFDSDFGEVSGRLHGDIDANVRDAYFGLRYLSETYVSHLTYQRMSAAPPEKGRRAPGPGRQWIVPRRWDHWLTVRLFNVAPEEQATRSQLRMFRSLFQGGGSPLPGEPPGFADARRHLADVVTNGTGGTAVAEARPAIESLFPALPAGERTKAVNRMLRRAILEPIAKNLHRLMANNAQLVEIGVESAQEIADALGAYGRWRVAPTGPLGALSFAFTEYYDDEGDEPARLSTAAFGGDPHTYVLGLGDTTALAHAGTRRIVLGLSATAFFPGAPHHHVHTDPAWYVRDNNPKTVEVAATPIRDDRDNLLHVSGLDGATRAEATRRIAARLWSTALHGELERLRGADEQRARVLLATTSYAGARHVAEGLARASVDSARICLAVRPQEAGAPGTGSADGWQTIRADRLEDFPARKEADILIAPLARVQRGVNIIGAGNRSALGSVWLIVRPIPLLDEPAELLAHVQAAAHNAHPGPSTDPVTLLQDRRRTTEERLDDMVRRPPYFRAQHEAVKLAVVAETLNGAFQLIGRARRGGTDAVLHLVDGAMLDEQSGTSLAALIRLLHEKWRSDGALARMKTYYGTTLQAFFDYAGVEEDGETGC
ncbi:hypothetical protein [Actinomadura algeriensis]|uniref:Helicase ATP-binding domain-containing protein n=1 Tax=Actinomadura algeriensis TaxID=1679523 RepID=A0ABR9K2N1_9ACTN|nr:hypothetical protein [Actinomadura algeriensis]MBE1537083.1 hypothetical protein [Actinomadura algeriensis]